jgi:hypothetical protein
MKLQSSTLPLSYGGILHHTKSLMEVLELRPGKQFGEDICNLLVCRKVCIKAATLPTISVLVSLFGEGFKRSKRNHRSKSTRITKGRSQAK